MSHNQTGGMSSRPSLTLRRVLDHVEGFSLNTSLELQRDDRFKLPLSISSPSSTSSPPKPASTALPSNKAPSHKPETKSTEVDASLQSTSSAEQEKQHERTVTVLNSDTTTTSRNRLIMLFMLKDKLLEDAKWCWANPTVPVLPYPVLKGHPLTFHRDFVHKNTPCLVEDMNICTWSETWDWEDLQLAANKGPVRVNATPTGRGDAVVEHEGEKVFVMPEERMMELKDFFHWLTDRKGGESETNKDVLYLSAQNDSLRDEFSSLISSGFAPPSLEFGDQVFGKKADAVNLWIGDDRAVTSMHRDTTYENMYCVVRGKKVFHLLPPCCAPFLGEMSRRNAQYVKRNEEWTMEIVGGDTPWIELDVTDKDKASFLVPEFAMCADMVQRVEVNEGQMLYVPAGWFHRVTQVEATVAVNYWYDRDFNSTWALTEAIEHLVLNA